MCLKRLLLDVRVDGVGLETRGTDWRRFSVAVATYGKGLPSPRRYGLPSGPDDYTETREGFSNPHT